MEKHSRERIILHVDMDCFFVSVALLDFPECVGVPSAVANNGPRAVVTSASYEARSMGVSCAMPLARAKQLCPRLVVLPFDMAKFKHYSAQVMDILREFTPLVEAVSIDEAYLDVTGSVRIFGSGLSIAEKIRHRLKTELGLPASVGIGHTKYIAKLASSGAKPDGVLEIPVESSLSYVRSLPVKSLWGVGSATAEKLAGRGVSTVAALAEMSQESLMRLLGKANGEKMWQLAHGIDDRAVEPDRTEKSVGNEVTFPTDVTDRVRLRAQLLESANGVASRLRNRGLAARTIAIKVRWHTFDTVTKSITLNEYTASSRKIYQTALTLFEQLDTGRPVRLIGLKCENLGEPEELLSLWEEDNSWDDVDETVDKVRQKFGSAGLKSARLI